MNKAIISGNLGKDVELRYTANGKAVATFSVAINEKFGGEKHTTWLNVVVWEKTAENCAQYLKKGSKVLVEGRIQIREWTNKENQKQWSTEIVAFNVEFLSDSAGGKKNSGGSGASGGPPPPEDADIPF